VRLLAGGNPQIAKGQGDTPVQAYIAAMPGWKRAVGTRLDALIRDAVPGVRTVVKWNSPLYGAALTPPPPEPSRSGDTRYLHIREDAALDEARFVAWVVQASGLPGERM
jgi:hypothetical protein